MGSVDEKADVSIYHGLTPKAEPEKEWFKTFSVRASSYRLAISKESTPLGSFLHAANFSLTQPVTFFVDSILDVRAD